VSTRSTARSTARIEKHEVVGAALKILAEHGVEGLTMRRLGDEMGVAGGAFYHHFRDKADILRAVARFALAEIDVPPVTEFDSWRDWVVQVATNYRGLLVERPYIAPLILNGYVPRAGLAVYSVERDLLSTEGIPSEAQETILDSLEAFVLGSAIMRTNRTVVTAESEEKGLQEFRAGVKILLDGLVLRARNEESGPDV
jgi:TetR/AcrR family tetracycline transcriptional repressor